MWLPIQCSLRGEKSIDKEMSVLYLLCLLTYSSLGLLDVSLPCFSFPFQPPLPDLLAPPSSLLCSPLLYLTSKCRENALKSSHPRCSHLVLWFYLYLFTYVCMYVCMYVRPFGDFY